MAKFIATLLSGLLFSGLTLAGPAVNQNTDQSFFNAVLEVNAMNMQGNTLKVDGVSGKASTHESQRGNSLIHAVLAMQKVNVNIQLNSHSEINYSRHTATSEKEKNNSLVHGALSK